MIHKDFKDAGRIMTGQNSHTTLYIYIVTVT